MYCTKNACKLHLRRGAAPRECYNSLLHSSRRHWGLLQVSRSGVFISTTYCHFNKGTGAVISIKSPTVICCTVCISQSNELTRGPPELISSALSFIGSVHIGAKALHLLNLIMVWLCRSPIPVGRRGYFLRSEEGRRGGGGGLAPCDVNL